MNKKSIIAGMLMGAVIAAGASTYAAVESGGGDGQRGGHGKERMEKVKEFFEMGGDYGDFVEMIKDERGEGARIPDQDHFDLMKDLFEAKVSGDNERVKEIRGELKVDREERKLEVKERKEIRKSAIENNDYDAFIEGMPEDRAEKMTEDVFELIKEMHSAREVGDREKMKEVRGELRELGFEKKGHGQRRGHGERG